MKKRVIKLGNAIFWDRHEGDKVYMDKLQIVIHQFPFDIRQVFVRFASGPALDFSIVDMDRLAVAYLAMRGVELSTEVRDLAKAKPAPWGDFVVPKRLMPKSLTTRGVKLPAPPGNPRKGTAPEETARGGRSSQKKARRVTGYELTKCKNARERLVPGARK